MSYLHIILIKCISLSLTYNKSTLMLKIRTKKFQQIWSITLGSFKSKLSYKTAKSVSELNERLMAAFKEVPGLIHKVICNNEVVINRLTGIVAPLLAESVHTDIKVDLVLIYLAIALTENINLKISSEDMLKTISRMNNNFNPILDPNYEQERLQA